MSTDVVGVLQVKVAVGQAAPPLCSHGRALLTRWQVGNSEGRKLHSITVLLSSPAVVGLKMAEDGGGSP